MLNVLSSDLLKMKRKMIWFLIFLGPIGVIGLETVNFTFRYEWLTKVYADDLWGGLIGEVKSLALPTLMMGLTIITSMIANIEHQTNAWKQLLALPISKTSVFTGKFSLASLLLLVSSGLLYIGTIILGIGLKFGLDIPYLYLAKMIFYPYFASMPFIALQIWLSITMKNQAVPLTLGILGMMISMFSYRFPDWVPWKYPMLENNWGGPIYSVGAGLMVGALIYLVGLIDFIKKDVK